MNPQKGINAAYKKKSLSDYQKPLSNSVPLRISQLGADYPTHIKIPIKINKNKLPIDFFPKTQSTRRRSINKNMYQQRAYSEKKNISPDKTSFFGFFNDEENLRQSSPTSRAAKRTANIIVQSRKQLLNNALRNLTPLQIPKRRQLITLRPTPNDNDQVFSPTLLSLSAANSNKISPRKQYYSKYIEQQMSLSPQNKLMKNDSLILQKKKLQKQQTSNTQNKKKDEDLTMTFFNMKSVSFPPIDKAKI